MQPSPFSFFSAISEAFFVLFCLNIFEESRTLPLLAQEQFIVPWNNLLELLSL